MSDFYKRAGKDEILLTLKKMESEGHDFTSLLLQRDTFWIYCRCRRLFGTYRNACSCLDMDLEGAGITSETGYEIDWWPYRGDHSAREGLGVVLNYLWRKEVDISAEGLKRSPYFDLYTDAINMFGTYDDALEYGNVPVERDVEGRRRELKKGMSYPENSEVLSRALEIYTTGDQSERNRLMADLALDDLGTRSPLDMDVRNTVAVVDGMNISYGKGNEPTLENVDLVEEALRDLGVDRERILFLFDASFPYKLGPEERTEFEDRLGPGTSYSMAPAGETADSHILSYAYDRYRQDPDNPPMIISNDKFREYFTKREELAPLREYKQGVTFISAAGERKAIISRFKDV